MHIEHVEKVPIFYVAGNNLNLLLDHTDLGISYGMGSWSHQSDLLSQTAACYFSNRNWLLKSAIGYKTKGPEVAYDHGIYSECL